MGSSVAGIRTGTYMELDACKAKTLAPRPLCRVLNWQLLK